MNFHEDIMQIETKNKIMNGSATLCFQSTTNNVLVDKTLRRSTRAKKQPDRYTNL
jgi:hypothetical protein